MSAEDAIDTEHAADLLAGRIALDPLTPEASSRRYFRPIAPSARGWLVVRGSEPVPSATAEWLTSLGIRVPRIGPAENDVYLVEDLGDRHLVHEPTLAHYEVLLGMLEQLGAATLPPSHPNAWLALDEELFLRELLQFREWYLQAFRKRAHSPKVADEVDALCAQIAADAAAGTWCPQHRDMHSRNVLVLGDGTLAWIDHQDLRAGPLLYDYASLLTDAYVGVTNETSELIVEHALGAGERAGWTREQAKGRLDATALQRVLKALGTFGKLIALGRGDYRPAEKRARAHAMGLFAQYRDYASLEDLVR